MTNCHLCQRIPSNEKSSQVPGVIDVVVVVVYRPTALHHDKIFTSKQRLITKLTFYIKVDVVGFHVFLFGRYLTLVGAFITRLHILDDETPLICALVVIYTDASITDESKKSYGHRMRLCGFPPCYLNRRINTFAFKVIDFESNFAALRRPS